MDSHDAVSHSFIVKVWVEATRSPPAGANWRGQITHVPSGERRHLDDLDSIPLFIAPWLETLGVHLRPYWQVRLWLTQRKHRRRRN